MKIKTRLEESEFEELIRPKLKLFMSVDIVGSTHYKQSNPKQQTPKWVGLFIGFFADFPERLAQAVSSLSPQLKLPRLWKALGDELIFTVELEKRGDAAIYVKAHSRALRGAASNWHGDSTDTTRHELHLKGAAWLVGFPVGNVEIPLLRSMDAAKLAHSDRDSISSDDLDYIGPLVDMGFRLKELASPRKLVLAADLVYLMVCADMDTSMRLFFEGDVQLKGVMGGKGYPVIWLDNDGHPESEHTSSSSSVNRCKDTLLGRHESKIDDLRNYLKVWLASAKGCPPTPFIVGDPNGDLIPDKDYATRRLDTSSDLRRQFIADTPPSEEQTGASQLPSGPRNLLASLTPSSLSTRQKAMYRIPTKAAAPRASKKKAAKRRKLDR